MTFILSQFNDITKLLALSDTLVSVPSNLNPAPVTVPFRDDPLTLSAGGYSPASFKQKMVIFGRTLILWADRLVVAKALIEQIVIDSNGGNDPLELEQILSNYAGDESELDEVSFIYHHDYFGNSPTRFSWRCEEHQSGDFNLIVGGSGTWNFMENVEYMAGAKEFAPGAVLPLLIGKVMSHAITEHISTTSLNFLYGGWFELIYPFSKYAQKLPYAVKFWYKEQDKLVDGPLIFGWYCGYDLCITTERVVEGVKSVSEFWINDLLKRPRPPPEFPIRPSFVFHAVIEENSSNFESYLEPYPLTSNEMMLSIDGSGVRSWFSRRLTKRLRNIRSPANIGTFKVAVL